MQELDFYLDDGSARLNGIMQQSAFSFSRAVPRITTVKIPGKSGDLHIEGQAYDNRTGSVKCYTLQENSNAGMADILSFLFSGKNTYRKLQTSDDPLHYWEARISNGGDISSRLGLLNPFNIEFDCKPFRRLLSGDVGFVPTNEQTIYNSTGFDAEPLIYFTASGEGTIKVNEDQIYILSGMEDTIIMDSEKWTVYPEGSERYLEYNKNISAEYFPVFKPLNNTIMWTGGVTVTQIVPRWRTL